MRQRLPDYLKKGIINTDKTRLVREILKKYNLNTVCDGARCPNKCECYAKNTATFLIMGNTCTRNCRFCNITGGTPEQVDPKEPGNIAKAIKELALNYAVITSVTRDDLENGGAEHFSEVIASTKSLSPDVKVEVLTPDFQGSTKALDILIAANPDVFNHNMETVKSLYKTVRPKAFYERSLDVLKYVKAKGLLTKTGIMLGLGETREDLCATLQDIKAAGCDVLTIGQYIQPSKLHLKVEKFYSPEEFADIKTLAESLSIPHVEASPLVRSSYKAFLIYDSISAPKTDN